MCLEREILNAVGFEIPQLEPEDVVNQAEEIVVEDEPIANTIDNFSKLLDEYAPVSN